MLDGASNCCNGGKAILTIMMKRNVNSEIISRLTDTVNTLQPIKQGHLQEWGHSCDI